jgi:hypothetical protein
MKSSAFFMMLSRHLTAKGVEVPIYRTNGYETTYKDGNQKTVLIGCCSMPAKSRHIRELQGRISVFTASRVEAPAARRF